MPDQELFRSRSLQQPAAPARLGLETTPGGASLHTAVYAHLTEAICALEELNYGLTWNGEPTELHRQALQHIRAARAGLEVMKLEGRPQKFDHKAAAANQNNAGA